MPNSVKYLNFIFYLEVNLNCFINWVDNVNWPPQRGSEADVSSISASSERIEELWVACGLYMERRS